jgi:hypothetical protein
MQTFRVVALQNLQHRFRYRQGRVVLQVEALIIQDASEFAIRTLAISASAQEQRDQAKQMPIDHQTA